ncbi:MAG: glycoside hydrolase family 1 protein [Candidatus Omnitrophica bacterium]|nr:glycoside hydrolase family 1 protein [Candidatus Omnitrophota bacterium]
MLEFPKGFWWGSSTSSYQVEGDNFYSDWWHYEKKHGLEPSGKCCRHYDLYKEDFDLAKSLNHNAHRFSIEWARVEPREGFLDFNQIEHYRDVVISLRERNLEPLVTLNHFTLPLWFAQKGGWLNKEAIDYFLRYVEKIVQELASSVRFWITINEPMVYIYQGYFKGIWPPQKRSLFRAIQVYKRLVLAHTRAYRLIHRIYKEKNLNSPLISIAKHLRGFFCWSKNPYHKFISNFKDYLFNFMILDDLIKNKSLDFIGVNYYTSEFIALNSEQLKDIPKSNLGWFIYPEGLYSLLLKLKRYNLDIFILENGISTDDDNQRWNFIEAHLKQIYKAIQNKAKIIGYLYWSLLDNFEWEKGFCPHFGLIDVDYRTFSRTIRRSAKNFSQVCKEYKL